MVLVKRAKDGQDLRVDLPAIGPRTVRRAAEAGCLGIAVGAGDTLVLDRRRRWRSPTASASPPRLASRFLASRFLASRFLASRFLAARPGAPR